MPSAKPPIKTTGKLSSAGWLALGLLLLLLVGGVAFAGYNYYFVLAKPEKVLEQALDNLKNFNSGEIKNTSSLTFKSNDNGLSPLMFFGNEAVTVKLQNDLSFIKKDNNYQTQGQISAELPLNAGVPLLSAVSFAPKVDFISVEKDSFFVKISGLPLGELFFGDADLGFIDKWIKVDLTSLQSLSGLKVDIQFEQEQAEKMRVRLVDLYKKNSFLVLKKLPIEKIDEVATYHYQFSLDEVKFKTFLLGLEQIAKEIDPATASRMSFDDAQIDEFLATSTLYGDLWITTKTKIFKKVQFNLAVELKDGVGSVSLFSETVLDKYNEPLEVTPPQDYLPFDQVWQQTVGMAQTKSQGARIVADVKQMQTAFELYFNDQNGYPAPPSAGHVLGRDATCLSEAGFSLGSCADRAYMSLLPTHPQSPQEGYNYYSCNKGSYIIVFNLPVPTGNVAAGINYATENGISNTLSENQKDCLASQSTAVDSDSDGLTDDQEALYGSDPKNSDTDGDTYLDGAEVTNGFNPNGEGQLSQ